MAPAISILIRTFNSAATLPEVLARLELQTDDEIIVVDSGSSDATPAIAEKNHARILSAPPPFNYSKSLNIGFRAAKNPWVLVISSHCVPLSENLMKCFRDAILKFPATVAVAYGDCSLVQREPPAKPVVLFADKTTDIALRRQVYGGNSLALYRRAAWEKQPFDETLPTAEDLAWFLRALADGALAARVPQAQALYRNQGSLRHMFRKGWLESRLAIELAGAPAANFFQFALNFSSLVKKCATGKIPASALPRQSAHALGAYLSPKFSRSKINADNKKAG
jgi:glycosyltransferase involved in cell wall biosynthesis